MNDIVDDNIKYPILFSYRKDKYNKIAELFKHEYSNLEVRTKKEFCEKYNICLNTLNKCLRLFNHEDH